MHSAFGSKCSISLLLFVILTIIRFFTAKDENKLTNSFTDNQEDSKPPQAGHTAAIAIPTHASRYSDIDINEGKSQFLNVPPQVQKVPSKKVPGPSPLYSDAELPEHPSASLPSDSKVPYGISGDIAEGKKSLQQNQKDAQVTR